MLVALVLLILFVQPLMLCALFKRIIVSHMQSMEEVGHQLSRQLLDYHLFEVDRHLEGEVDILVVNPSHRQYQHHYNPLPFYPHDQSPISSDLPSVHHPTYSDLLSVQPPTFLDPPSVQPPISLNLSSVQVPTFSDPPSTQPLTSSNPPSVQPPTSLDLPPLQPPTSSDPPSVQIDTSTQLDYRQPFRMVDGTYVDLDCYLHHHLYFQLQPHHR